MVKLKIEMMRDTHRISRNYGIAQTIILIIYTGIFFLDHTPHLFERGLAGVAAIGLCAFGLLMMLFAFLSIRGVIQVQPEPRAEGKLITSGIYKYFRHPIYMGIFILMLGLFLRKPTIPIAVITGIVIIFVAIKVRFEEELLIARYPEYTEYKKHTIGFLPW